MNHCPNCGNKGLVSLYSGGCGGAGGIDGCPKCDAAYEQETGGIVPTYGGERYSRLEDSGYKEQCYWFARELKPHKQDWRKEDEDYGKWFWTEIGWGETHRFGTEAEAKTALAAYVAKLKSELPYPNCDRCGKQAQKRGYGAFDCKLCQGWIDVSRSSGEGKWRYRQSLLEHIAVASAEKSELRDDDD